MKNALVCYVEGTYKKERYHKSKDKMEDSIYPDYDVKQDLFDYIVIHFRSRGKARLALL